MSLVLNLFRKTLKFPVLWVSLIYLFWWILIPTNESFYDGIRILTIYFIITVLERLSLSSTNKTLTVVLFVVLLPLISLSCIFALSDWWPDSVWYYRHLIYLPLIIIFLGYKAYNLFQIPLSENKSLHILWFIAMFPVLVINIAYPVSYFPKVLDQKEFGNSKYYIVLGFDIDYRDYLSFYKCEKWSFKCDTLYREYFQLNFDTILIDKDRGEVSAVRESGQGLVFTDGDTPRRYQGDSVRLGDHVYQMAVDNRDFLKCVTTPFCDSYTYKLYECNLDNISCSPLPVQYTTTYENSFSLNANEVTNEINVSDYNDTLLFTYGKHPVCYVKDCAILDQ